MFKLILKDYKMNPRVKELAEQAGGVVLTGSEIQKFAELIVRECVNICDDIADPTLYREAEYHSRMAPGASYAGKVIKLRFLE